MKVYLAGKIAKNDWRHTVVADLRNTNGELVDPYTRRGVVSWPCPGPAFGNFGQFEYTGPFFLSCDHGCGHGDGEHGYGRGVLACCGEGSAHARDFGRKMVWEANLRAIDRSDVLLAVVEAADCHGTLAEIGYAVGKGKPVGWLHVLSDSLTPEQVDDLWFVRRFAAVTLGTTREGLCESILRMLGAYLGPLLFERRARELAELKTMPYLAYLQTDHWRAVRAEAIARAGGRCQLCGKSNGRFHVHHNSYDNRGEEQPEDLVALCAACHAKHHNK